MGSVGLAIDGQPVDVGGPEPQSILSVLALSAGRSVSRLRRSMGTDPPLRSTQGGYLLDVQRGDVDLFAFENTVSLLLADRNTDPDVRALALSEALSSWDTPLGGLRTSERLRGQIAPFAELHFRGIEALASRQILGSQPSDAIRTLSALVREHPARESLWLLLARGFARIGQRDASLDAIQHAREELRMQLGVNPSPSCSTTSANCSSRASNSMRRHPSGPSGPTPRVRARNDIGDADRRSCTRCFVTARAQGW
jgi:DNA-binding SARP family transcriptional activator